MSPDKSHALNVSFFRLGQRIHRQNLRAGKKPHLIFRNQIMDDGYYSDITLQDENTIYDPL